MLRALPRLAVQAVDVQLTVPKRIVLFLARESPDLTIDHLVGEASRLIYEDDSYAAPTAVGRALHLPTASGTSTATPRNREKVNCGTQNGRGHQLPLLACNLLLSVLSLIV